VIRSLLVTIAVVAVLTPQAQAIEGIWEGVLTPRVMPTGLYQGMGGHESCDARVSRFIEAM
jgi:hypothetical protein